MALIYDSSHSGQEIDAAVDAVQTTIPSQLTQIGSKIGDLANLQTTEKANLVGAVNEVKSESVWNKSQTLSDAQKAQARANIDAQKTITVDNVPTEGSGNLVSSGGVAQQISVVNSKIDNIKPINLTNNGTITNLADEDDITSENNLLKLKDRYNYVILRSNKTFASQVTKADTIYEIRYDFDLDGASVTIPSGCVLKFNGGKLSNGTITGNGTRLEAPLVAIFNDSLTLAGSWNINECYAEWFGAVTDDSSLDCSTAINKALSVKCDGSKYVSCRLLGGTYYTKSSVVLDGSKSLYGNKYNETYIKTDSVGSYAAIEFIGSSNSLSSISVLGNASEGDSLVRVGIAVGKSDLSKSATRGEIRDVDVRRCDVGVALYYQWCNTFGSISVARNNVGISVATTETVLYKCNMEQNYSYGLVSTGDGVHVIGCVIEGNKYGCSLEGSVNDIIDCYFESNSESFLNPSAQKNERGTDIYGGHIIAGMSSTLSHLAIINCHFKNSSAHNNDIYVDKCNSLNIECPPEEITPLKTTDNTFINSLPTHTGAVLYNPSSSQKKSALPFFSVSDFSAFEQSGNNAVLLLSANYLRIYSASSYIKSQNGVLYSYRTTENSSAARRIECFIGGDIYANFKNPICVIEYEINNPNARIVTQTQIRQNGTYTRIQNAAPTKYLTPERRARIILNFKKLGVDNLADYDRIDFMMYLNEDTFVSEEEDMGSKSFIMTGLYFYDGDNFDYNGNNTFNEFSRHTSDRYIARTGSVYSPQTSRPAIPEKGMVIYDDSLNKLILYNGSAWKNLDGSALS